MTPLLRLPRVLAIVNVSQRTLQRWIDAGHFPAPFRAPSGARLWRSEDVQAWVDGLKKEDAA